MCGRYNVLPDAAAFIDVFNISRGIDRLDDRPLYNIAPSSQKSETQVPIVRCSKEGERELLMSRWPLIPFWSKERFPHFNTANAKGETVSEKPAFREPWRRGRRCLVPANGYYEWQMVPGQKNKQPYHICLPDQGLFAFAGLWDRWRDEDGNEVESCTIITTTPTEKLLQIHSRMPLIVDRSNYDTWLNDTAQKAAILIRPYTEQPLAMYAISTFVNNPKNDDPKCLAPLEESA